MSANPDGLTKKGEWEMQYYQGKGSGSFPGFASGTCTLIAQQVVIVPDPSYNPASGSDAMYRVIIVPTAATGVSAVTRQYPQIIQFKWPNRRVDDALGGAVPEQSDKETATYLSILKTVFDKQLAPFGKEVIIYTNETKTAGHPPPFNCSAELSPVRDTFITEKALGETISPLYYKCKPGLFF
ncbi:hypothetical protein G7Z17_g1061 [Cylindrodendrum hubeiense]|uniref:Uncharacterized protein n=1 Tax=Cylindrodendrum hubeiense TaxID=595255 RepID=A0A9P5HGR0_9HYPO|nr:hypothetical protein G7Z17_g1061 [Cylindrodendrum hubeiense]